MKNMKVFSKINVSDLLFDKIDAIIVVDAKKDTYQTIKKTGIFEKILKDDGDYKELVEKLWFHFSDRDKKITDDYHVFVPMFGKFKGKYVDRIKLRINKKSYLAQISIYPLDESGDNYLFTMDELDNSAYLRNFLTDQKADTIQSSFLFSMYVDLIKDISYSINITELSNNPQGYDVKYSVWREMIVNMIWPDDQKLFLERTDPEYLKKNLGQGRTSSFDCQMKNLEGEFIWVKLIFSRATTTNEDDFRFVFMVQNIHETSIKLFEALKKYEDLASRDALTSIFNHGRIETEISNSIETYNTKAKAVSFMMIDIDFFKRVNDKFGHSVGDIVLKQFVNVVTDFIKPYDITIGRWGGEEFMVLLPNADSKRATDIAELFRTSFAAIEFEYAKHQTMSLGVTELIAGESADISCMRVDDALYEAKNTGKNRVVVK